MLAFRLDVVERLRRANIGNSVTDILGDIAEAAGRAVGWLLWGRRG
jgi:hypothetical protein